MGKTLLERAVDLAQNPEWSNLLCPFLLVVEAVLNALIIKTVPYTEIDWVAYMQQAKQYILGELDYTKISGDTGPLVYPALHVYIYKALYYITQGGANITLAQVVFLFLYLLNLGLVFLCYRQAKVPPWVYPMLILSKRMHSIYVLRCFNDGFAMTFFFLATYAFQRKQWPIGAIAFSLGLGVKMSLLLALPAVAAILYQAVGPTAAIGQAARIAFIQVLLGAPFLRENWKGYVSRAFDLGRVFLYKWTVNWRFVSEERFLSGEFAIGLAAIHLSLLGVFMFTRWLKPLGKTTGQFFTGLLYDSSKEVQAAVTKRVTPDFILTTMLSANVIGMLCARSLHYQFYAWLGWATPFLLYRSGLNPALVYLLWFGQEVAWLQYPSTDLSSKIVVGVLAATVLQIWIATDDPAPSQEEQRRAALKEIMASRPDAVARLAPRSTSKAASTSVSTSAKSGSTRSRKA